MSPIINITDPVGCCPYGGNQGIGSACKLENLFFFPLQNAVFIIKSHTNNNEQPPPSFALLGADGVMDQQRPRKVFPLSSALGAHRGPAFYERVKCLVDALHLIYDHNNNGAAGLRKRQQPRENKIWKHKA